MLIQVQISTLHIQNRPNPNIQDRIYVLGCGERTVDSSSVVGLVGAKEGVISSIPSFHFSSLLCMLMSEQCQVRARGCRVFER
jgi:hypothetical protein